MDYIKKSLTLRFADKESLKSGSTWTKMVNGRSVLACSSASTQRFKQWDKEALIILHLYFYRDTSHQYIHLTRRNIINVFLMRNIYAHPYSVSSVISIQMNEQNHICNANSVDVCLRAACVSGRYNVLFCIPHTCSIRTRALWILISHFVISRYAGGEVCALECEASVCLSM